MNILNEISEAILRGNVNFAKQNVIKAINQGIDPETILNEGLLASMALIGKRFKSGEIFVPTVLLCAKAINVGLDEIQPLLRTGEKPNKGTVVIGTVKGDLHDIGKNLVIVMLRSSGFEVIDLGYDVSDDRFVEAVLMFKPDILALSALLNITTIELEKVIKSLKRNGIRNQVKVMVGGAPVREEYAKAIGADIYAMDAVEAANKAKEIVGE